MQLARKVEIRNAIAARKLDGQRPSLPNHHLDNDKPQRQPRIVDAP